MLLGSDVSELPLIFSDNLWLADGLQVARKWLVGGFVAAVSAGSCPEPGRCSLRLALNLLA